MPKKLAEASMTFWLKSWSMYRNLFFKGKNVKMIFIWTVKLQFWLPNLLENSNELPLKFRQNFKYKNFLKKNWSTERPRHVERSFDNFAQNFSQTFWKIVQPNHKTLKKVYSFKKDFVTMKYSSSNAKRCFGNPAERWLWKVRKTFGHSPKINERLILFWKKLSSNITSRELKSSVENDVLVSWAKSKHFNSKFK